MRTEGKNTYIDLKPDDDWLKDSSRAYPVTIDPSISVQGSDKTFDASISSATAAQNVNFAGDPYLITGTYTDSIYGTGVYRSYIKFGLAPLLSSANITSAKLTLYQYSTTQPEQVDLYSVASDWTSTGIKWTQVPATGTLITSTNVSDVGFYDFDITSLVKQWYGGTTSNYGVMLRLNKESDNRKSFRSSDYATYPSQKPMLTVTYTIDPIGVESFWTSAVTNVNTYNGNFYLEDSDVSIDGRGTGLSIDRSYNSRSKSSGIFGYGWTSNLEQSLRMSYSGPIVYTDADGTTHTFAPEYGSEGTPTGTYKASGGVNLTLVKNGDNTFTIITPDQTRYNFNSSKKLASIVDSSRKIAKNSSAKYSFDGDNRLTKKVTQGGNSTTTTYTYDDAAQLTTKVSQPNGNTVEYGYDSVNRQNSVSYNGTQVYSFQYDANNNLTKETDETTGTSTNYSYDADNRLTSVQEPNSNQTDYTYDANGNVTQQKLTAGSTVITQGFAYNSNNQLTKITSNGANQAWFNYNEQDQVARRKTADGNMTFNRYNGAEDLVERDIFDKYGNLLYSFVYAYDNKGRITSVTETDGTNPPKTTSYQYDALDQLTKETRPDGTVIEYTYDETGNRLTKKVTQGGNSTTTTYTYDDADQLTSVNGTNYTYDANGNLTSDGSKTYVYDAANHLIQVKDSSGNTIASFTYRADGMRKTMTTASGTITFHYDQRNNVSYETDQSGAVVASYTYDDNNLPVSMTRGGKTYFYQLNGHGDVVALIDSTDAVVNTYTYDAFGNLVGRTGTVENPYTYAGYRYDKETGLYYLQSRYYNPETGRFLTRDTFDGFVNEPLSLNKYVYAENNPISNVDPSGQWSWGWKSYLKRLLNSIVSAIFSDLRANTLTDLAFFFTGGFGSAIRSFMGIRALSRELHFFDVHFGRLVFRRSIFSFIRGAIGGYALGKVANIVSYVSSVGNKLFAYETWFDHTRIGRYIDNKLTVIERYLHRLVNRW
ncbi:DNRLRE domain-containing protein [Thermoactinomyces sp. CICC 10521]|uniref:DNRLRE domain-containing protein n=1 Tax=Thermoactinomyces sp. CICC 10521 TaxID=2767426 RepID=UPI0018DD4D4A|nr:DNRLRE domain-containing protein [Thermoactinomyces sp. CICC 10521]MBH8609076.1 DNRLRE domain-containing protein [Thermoactinomyces sp. CICC 10521]